MGLGATTPLCRRRHSLVTPIDWKHPTARRIFRWEGRSRHSLVTPIDWKLAASKRSAEIVRGGSPFFGDAY